MQIPVVTRIAVDLWVPREQASYPEATGTTCFAGGYYLNCFASVKNSKPAVASFATRA